MLFHLFQVAVLKGLFRRVCSAEQAVLYCGDEEKLSPGILRFHGAYPIDDWAATKEVTIRKRGSDIKETRYRMVDVVHPQQKRQVEGINNNRNKATALAIISFYQPSFIFEFSSASSEIDWQEVEQLILNAVLKGIGGKTSTGYGLGGHLPSQSATLPDYPLNIPFSATGVSPLLRNDEPEFRPNLFKATLRGHFTRLLSGVCNNEKAITKEVDRFFGSYTSPGIVQIYWESQKEEYNTTSTNATYETEGILHIKAPPLERKFLELVLKFGFIMGGFGKSWRRVDHKKFYPEYKKLSQGINIGCHWECQDSTWCNITTIKDLKDFFENLHEYCNSRLGSKNLDFIRLKETWHPQRVSVYSKIVANSKVVRLFHNDIFKQTPAIGGKNVGDTRPKFVSSVWHRMLPINNNQYLEIVTIFHHNRSAWKHQEEGNQLKNFVKELKDKEFSANLWKRTKLKICEKLLFLQLAPAYLPIKLTEPTKRKRIGTLICGIQQT